MNYTPMTPGMPLPPKQTMRLYVLPGRVLTREVADHKDVAAKLSMVMAQYPHLDGRDIRMVQQRDGSLDVRWVARS